MANRVLTLLILALPVAGQAQSLQSSFSSVTYDRSRTPATFAGGVVQVDSASGAASIDIPLGPGIGRGTLRFQPSLRGRFAPEMRVLPAYTPGPEDTPPFLLFDAWESRRKEVASFNNLYTAMQVVSGGGASLLPGYFDLVVDNRRGGKGITHFLLPDGSASSVGAILPEAQLPAKPDAVLRAFGFLDGTVIAKVPAPDDATVDRSTLPNYSCGGAGDELVLGLSGVNGEPPAKVGDAATGYYLIPNRILVARGEAAYEFVADYSVRTATHIPDTATVAHPAGKTYFDLRLVRYRLSRSLDRFGNSITFRFAADGVGYTATWKSRAGGELASVTATFESGGFVAENTPCLLDNSTRTQFPELAVIHFNYQGFVAPSYRVEAVTADGSLLSNGALPSRVVEAPATLPTIGATSPEVLATNLQPRRVRREAAADGSEPEEDVVFHWALAPLGIPSWSNSSELYYPTVLSSVAVPGRTASFTWDKYPWRPNDAVEPGSGGAFTPTKPLEYPSFFYGVSEHVEMDHVQSVQRRTTHHRVVPVPDTTSAYTAGWTSSAFYDLVGNPDGTATGYRFYEPVNPATGYVEAHSDSAAKVLQTYGFLKHLIAEVRHYSREAEGVTDLALPVSTAAFMVEHRDKLALHRAFNPQGDVYHGSEPRALRSQILNRNTGVASLVESASWNASTFGWEKEVRYHYGSQSTLPMAHNPDGTAGACDAPHPGANFDGTLTRTWSPNLKLGLLGRLGSESGYDRAPRVFSYDDGATGGAEASLKEISEGEGGNIRKTRFLGYNADGLATGAEQSGTVAGLAMDGSGSIGVAEYRYDDAGFLTFIRPAGVSWSYQQTNDRAGRPLSQTDPNQLQTNFAWYPSGRLKSVTPPDGEQATFISYDPGGLAAEVSRGAAWSRDAFDGFGQLILTSRSNGKDKSVKKFRYDLAGRKVFESVWEVDAGPMVPAKVGTLLGYDGQGRLTSVQDPNGILTGTAYNGLTRTVDLGAERTLFTADPLGRLVEVVDALGQRTRYEFDGSSERLRTVTQTGTGPDQVRSWSYLAGLRWLSGLSQPESGITSYKSFHVSGSPAETVYGDQASAYRRVWTERGSLGRVTRIRSEDGTVDQVYRYDEPGHGAGNNKLTSADAQDISRSLFYSGLGGRLSGLDRTIGADLFTQSLEYDAENYGFIAKRVYPNGQVQKLATTGATGLPYTSEFPGLGSTAAVYHPLHWGLGTLAWGNGAGSTFTYGADQLRIETLKHQQAGSTLLEDRLYQYDGVTGRMTSDGQDWFAYDPLGRLRQALVRDFSPEGRTAGSSAALFQTFAYDAFGNRQQLSTQRVTNWPAGNAVPAELALDTVATDPRNLANYTLTEPELATLGARNQLPPTVGGSPTGASYDAQGNLSSINKVFGLSTSRLELTYDALGRVKTLFDPVTGLTEAYAYDDEGLRAMIQVFRTSASGSVLVAKHYRIYNEARQLVAEYDLAQE